MIPRLVALCALALAGPVSADPSVIFAGHDASGWGLWQVTPGEQATKLRSGELRGAVTAAGVLAWADPAGKIWTAPMDDATAPAQMIQGLPHPCGQPSLSTDGRWLAVACFRFSMRQDDGGLWRIDLTTGTPEAIYDEPGLQKSPVFSPDGRRIAFVTGFRLSADRVIEHVWIADADGSNAKSVAEKSDVNIDPSWDGNDALILRSDQGGQPGLWRADLSSGAMIPLQVNVRDAAEIAVSGQGEVAFTGYRDGRVGLWLTTTTGGAPQALAVTQNDGLDAAHDPYWTVDN